MGYLHGIPCDQKLDFSPLLRMLGANKETLLSITPLTLLPSRHPNVLMGLKR
jgi:hypothetical protein